MDSPHGALRDHVPVDHISCRRDCPIRPEPDAVVIPDDTIPLDRVVFRPPEFDADADLSCRGLRRYDLERVVSAHAIPGDDAVTCAIESDPPVVIVRNLVSHDSD